MQYGATLEPVIEKSIDRNIQCYSNRNANINRQAYYAAEQARILYIHILRFLTDLVDASDELSLIIKVAQEKAWKNMTNLNSDKTAAPAREETYAMAIVKAKYVRGKSRIKAHLRYITHRRGMEGERMTRPLFGRDGALSKLQIYDMIDAAKRGAVFHKFVINFHPLKEDTRKT